MAITMMTWLGMVACPPIRNESSQVRIVVEIMTMAMAAVVVDQRMKNQVKQDVTGLAEHRNDFQQEQQQHSNHSDLNKVDWNEWIHKDHLASVIIMIIIITCLSLLNRLDRTRSAFKWLR